MRTGDSGTCSGHGWLRSERLESTRSPPRWLRSERQRASRNQGPYAGRPSPPRWLRSERQRASRNQGPYAGRPSPPRWLRSERQRASRNQGPYAGRPSPPRWLRSERQRASRNQGPYAGRPSPPRWLRSERQRASRNHLLDHEAFLRDEPAATTTQVAGRTHRGSEPLACPGASLGPASRRRTHARSTRTAHTTPTAPVGDDVCTPRRAVRAGVAIAVPRDASCCRRSRCRQSTRGCRRSPSRKRGSSRGCTRSGFMPLWTSGSSGGLWTPAGPRSGSPRNRWFRDARWRSLLNHRELG